MIKLETHLHCFGGSSCATSPDEILIGDYAAAGYGGVVITNHICSWGYEEFKGDTHKEKVRYYYSLIENLTEKLKKQGIKTFWGSEIRVPPLEGQTIGNEFMIYGIEEKDMADNKPLCFFTQEELFRFAEKRHLFMYKTHPFRDGCRCGNPEFMHGAESFNGHFHHYNHNELAKEFCEKYNLIGMSGTDYHHEHQPITAGIYIPDDIITNEQLTEYIFKNDFKTIEDAEKYQAALKIYKES